ncbi:MAG TPA: hypothetical protein VMG39_14635 [Pseudolabrys sp.]|nr:hypothetical protein [Pseudolabrys sp.]
MSAHWKHAALATAALAFAITAVAMPNEALARKRTHAARPVASPPPSIGYYGEFPLQLDYAQAQAWSLARPYYTHFMYDYCDYRNCTLQFRGGAWVPVWYGPPS